MLAGPEFVLSVHITRLGQPEPAFHFRGRATAPSRRGHDLSSASELPMRTVEAPVLVLRLDTIVADRPRSADPPGRMARGWIPAGRGDAVEATGDPEGAKGDTDAEDSLLRGRVRLARGRGARSGGGPGPVEGPAGPECPAGFPPDAAGRRLRHAAGPEGHRRLQGRDW